MRIDEYQGTKENTIRIPLNVGDEQGFIDVFTFRSSEWARGMAWFKRASAQKMLDGVQLFESREVLGEKVSSATPEYEKLNTILFAHLISGWSFDDAVDLDSAAEFLLAHPHVQSFIDEKLSVYAAKEDAAKKPQSPTQEAK